MAVTDQGSVCHVSAAKLHTNSQLFITKDKNIVLCVCQAQVSLTGHCQGQMRFLFVFSPLNSCSSLSKCSDSFTCLHQVWRWWFFSGHICPNIYSKWTWTTSSRFIFSQQTFKALIGFVVSDVRSLTWTTWGLLVLKFQVFPQDFVWISADDTNNEVCSRRPFSSVYFYGNHLSAFGHSHLITDGSICILAVSQFGPVGAFMDTQTSEISKVSLFKFKKQHILLGVHSWCCSF